MMYRKRAGKKCQGCRKPKVGTRLLCRRCEMLQTKFRVNPKDANKLYDQQYGLCAICHKPQPDNRSLATDHDHVTGKIRGFLCTRCNMGLGYLHTPGLLKAAGIYLKAEPPQMRYIKEKRVRKVTDEDMRLVLNNPDLQSLRAKARALAVTKGVTNDAAMSNLRRFSEAQDTPIYWGLNVGSTTGSSTG